MNDKKEKLTQIGVVIVTIITWEFTGWLFDKGGEELSQILTPAWISLIVSVICCRISSAYTFNVIDDHVEKVFELLKQLIRDTYHTK